MPEPAVDEADAPVSAPPPIPRGGVVAGIVVGVVAISSSAVLVRLADAEPLALAFWRCLGGSVALAPFALRARRDAPPLDAGQRRQLLAAGFLLAIHFALWFFSLELTTVASSVTLVTMSPIFVGVGAALFLREPPPARVWAGMAVTIAGALVIGLADWREVSLGGSALVGDLLAFGGAVAVAGYLLAGRAARRRLPVSVYAAAVYGVAAAVLLTAAVATRVPLTGYDAGTWLAVAALVVGPQLLGHTVFNALLRSVTATVVSITTLAEPVGATLLAWLVLRELPPALFWAGAPLILVGVFTATVGRRRTAPAVTAQSSSPR